MVSLTTNYSMYGGANKTYTGMPLRYMCSNATYDPLWSLHSAEMSVFFARRSQYNLSVSTFPYLRVYVSFITGVCFIRFTISCAEKEYTCIYRQFQDNIYGLRWHRCSTLPVITKIVLCSLVLGIVLCGLVVSTKIFPLVTFSAHLRFVCVSTIVHRAVLTQ